MEQVEIEKGDTQESTTLFIGKYLSPKIFLSYGVGLFDPINTFRVRYQISRQIIFQTEYGMENSADLLFQMESKPKEN